VTDGILFGTDHPLCQLAMALIAQEAEGTPNRSLSLYYPTPEILDVELYEMSVVDGTGRELTREWISIARRESGQVIELDNHWIWQSVWNRVNEWDGMPETVMIHALQTSQRRVYELRSEREEQLNKKAQFLQRAFDAQYDQAAKRLEEYHRTNVDNRNSALINQVNGQLLEIEDKRRARLTEVERERSVQLRPLKRLIQVRLLPDGSGETMVIPSDYADVWGCQERAQGRTYVRVMEAFGPADLYSETAEGEGMFWRLRDGALSTIHIQ